MTDTTGDLLFLDDLRVGRRFTSGTHALGPRQIKAFANEFEAINERGITDGR